MKFFTRYDNLPPKTGIEFNEPSMTEQHFKDECDINNIVKRYQETGVLPQGNREPLFGDFSAFPSDLMESQRYFDEAQARFMQLDSGLRKEFDNNPAKLLAFLQDERNYDKAVELGLIARKSEVTQQVDFSVSSEKTIVSSSSAESVHN